MNADMGGSGGGASGSRSISSTLLERVRARQPDAWRRLVDVYGPVVYGWCRQAGVTPDDAQDLVQEVFAAVALHIHGFRRDRPGDSFSAWLSAVSRSVIRDHFRARRRRPIAQGGTDAQERLLQTPEPSASAETSHLQSASRLIAPVGLEAVRAEFEDRTWEAFHRAAIERQPPVRIAKELGMSVPAVYQAKSRVLRRLRRELDGLIP